MSSIKRWFWLTLTIVILPVSVYGAPISFNTALPVAKGEFIFREQFVYDESRRNAAASPLHRHAFIAESILGYGITPDLALFGVLPYVNKSADFLQGGRAVSREASGVGDMAWFARYTVFKKDWPGGTFRIAPVFGVEVPTGEDHEDDRSGILPPPVQPGSGSTDPFGGLVLTYATRQFQIDSQFAYKANMEGNDFEFGDISRWDASLQYRIWPVDLSNSVPGFLYGVLESNLIHRGKNRMNGIANSNSGGLSYFGFAGFQVPLYQDLNGSALEKEYVIRSGFRVNF